MSQLNSNLHQTTATRDRNRRSGNGSNISSFLRTSSSSASSSSTVTTTERKNTAGGEGRLGNKLALSDTDVVLHRYQNQDAGIRYSGYLLKRSNQPYCPPPSSSNELNITTTASSNNNNNNNNPLTKQQNDSPVEITPSKLTKYKYNYVFRAAASILGYLFRLAAPFLGYLSIVGPSSTTTTAAAAAVAVDHPTRTTPPQDGTNDDDAVGKTTETNPNNGVVPPTSNHCNGSSSHNRADKSPPPRCDDDPAPPPPPDQHDPKDGHVWRAKYIVLQHGVLYVYRSAAVGNSHDAQEERDQPVLFGGGDDSNGTCTSSRTSSGGAAGGGGGGMTESSGDGRGDSEADRVVTSFSTTNNGTGEVQSHYRFDGSTTDGVMWEKRIALHKVASVFASEMTFGQRSVVLLGTEGDGTDSVQLDV